MRIRDLFKRLGSQSGPVSYWEYEPKHQDWPDKILLDSGPIEIDKIHAGSRIELSFEEHTPEQIKQYVMAISFRTALPCGAEFDEDKGVWVIHVMAVPEATGPSEY